MGKNNQLYGRKNLLTNGAFWENYDNSSLRFEKFYKSIEGETIMINDGTLDVGGYGQLNISNCGLSANKMYQFIVRRFNNVPSTRSTLYRYSTLLAINAQTFSNIIASSANNIPLAHTICVDTQNAYRILFSNTIVGQNLVVERPVLYEDMNWTYNIVNTGIFGKIKNHFRADCSSLVSNAAKKVSAVYNTKGTQATQTTATKQPTLVNNLLDNYDNRDYLYYDGVDDTSVFSEIIAGEFDLWFVASGLPTSLGNCLFAKGTGSENFSDIVVDLGNSPQGIRAFYYVSPTVLRSIITTVAPPATGINLIRYNFNTITGSNLYLNGVSIGTQPNTNLPKNSSTNCYLGSRCDAGNYLSHKHHEYLSFNTVLDTNETNTVMNYLRKRYGQEANF